MKGLSVCIIAKDEAVRLPRTLEAIRGLGDELILIDSGSMDGTQQIAESYGARVIHEAWQGHAWAKAVGVERCRFDWVLMLDADEALSADLVEAIREARKNNWWGHSGFKMRWRLAFPGEDSVGLVRNQALLVRLWKIADAEIIKRPDSNDDRPKIRSGTLGKLPGYVRHQTFISLSHIEAKYVQLTDEQARDNVARGKNYPVWRLYIEHPIKLVKYLVFRKHALYGWYGWVLAWVAAHRNFMKIAKTISLYRMQQDRKQ